MIFPAIIALDQISKFIVLKLGFATSCNRGFAFGFAPGFLNIFISLLVLGLVFLLVLKEKRKNFLFGYLLILGGGVSNLIDRLIRGCVVDFIDLKIWPSFNLADSVITIGVAVLAFGMFMNIKSKKI